MSRDGGSGLVESNIDQANPAWFADLAAGDLHLIAGSEMNGILLTDEVLDLVDRVPDDDHRFARHPDGRSRGGGATSLGRRRHESNRYQSQPNASHICLVP